VTYQWTRSFKFRYRIHVWLFRHGWPIDKPVPFIGLDPTGRRDSAPALQAQLDVSGAMHLPATGEIRLGRTVRKRDEQ
jgi:hypothetical protein